MTATVEGLSSSEIRPPPTDSPSTPVKKRPRFSAVSHLSEDSSPLSSLRSTPSLLSFGDREIESDNKRIIALSYSCPRSKPVASTRKPGHDTTGLPTPASSPISLRDLNKRLLEGTIYQDGIALVKPEAPATLPVSKKQRKRSVTVSPFFAKTHFKKPKASEKVSCIPFPPLQSTSFGLVQERLSHDPFRLLIAVIFLNKTRGSVALPVFYELMDRYPTPADLAAASQEDVVDIIQHLGLQNQRAKKCINLAKAWLERPPEKGKRYRVLHYPKRDDGKDISLGDIIDEEDERVAWEIGQLPGVGVYAIDSWRIFCRDELRGLPTGLPTELTPEAKEEELQKEWTRVLAGDKELRAYLRWRWLRNGWAWDAVTGERKKADESELAKADKGGVIYEGDGGDVLVGAVDCEGSEAVKAEMETRNDDSGKDSAITADPKTRNASEPERETTHTTHNSTPATQHLISATDEGKAPNHDAEPSNQVSPLSDLAFKTTVMEK